MNVNHLPLCPVETTLSVVSSKWAIFIIRDLLTGSKRTGELKRSLKPISQKVLTQQLRQMEERGLVSRKVYPEVPPKVEYSLTELGRSLEPVLDSLSEWGTWYKSTITK